MKSRLVRPELMDDPEVDEQLLRKSLRFLTRLNRLFAGNALTVSALERLAGGRRSLRVLDVGTGAADMPRAFCRWAERRRLDLRITAVDNHPRTLAVAREMTVDFDAIDLRQADGLHLLQSEGGPFVPGEFDIVTASLFLHHFEDDMVVSILGQMRALAGLGVVWNDLWRHPWARLVTYLSTVPTAAIVRHDGRASINAGFTLAEARVLAEAAGWGRATVRTARGYRFVCWASRAS